MRTLGSQVVPARINELRRVLLEVSAEDVAQLDPQLAESLSQPLGHERLSVSLPMQDSVFVCLYNLDPIGFIVIHRSATAAHVRALAVSPDMRRKGLAQTMLIHAEERARERQLEWMWMSIPSSTVAAVHCARRCGYRRYLPQFLRRNISQMLPTGAHDVYLQPLQGKDAGDAVYRYYRDELENGDAWAAPLVEAELLPLLLPVEGQVWLCMRNNEEFGCIHAAGEHDHPVISLWLAREYWNTPAEMSCIRSVLSSQAQMPTHMDVRLGSEGHLRAALARYRSQRFVLAMHERVLFIKRVQPEN